MPEAQQQQNRLSPYERAARIYCELLKINPDATVDEPHPIMAGVVKKRPTWEIMAERMVDLSLMLTALQLARRRPPEAANDARASG